MFESILIYNNLDLYPYVDSPIFLTGGIFYTNSQGRHSMNCLIPKILGTISR